MAQRKNLVSRKKIYRKKGKKTMKKRNMKGGELIPKVISNFKSVDNDDELRINQMDVLEQINKQFSDIEVSLKKRGDPKTAIKILYDMMNEKDRRYKDGYFRRILRKFTDKQPKIGELLLVRKYLQQREIPEEKVLESDQDVSGATPVAAVAPRATPGAAVASGDTPGAAPVPGINMTGEIKAQCVCFDPSADLKKIVKGVKDTGAKVVTEGPPKITGPVYENNPDAVAEAEDARLKAEADAVRARAAQGQNQGLGDNPRKTLTDYKLIPKNRVKQFIGAQQKLMEAPASDSSTDDEPEYELEKTLNGKVIDYTEKEYYKKFLRVLQLIYLGFRPEFYKNEKNERKQFITYYSKELNSIKKNINTQEQFQIYKFRALEKYKKFITNIGKLDQVQGKKSRKKKRKNSKKSKRKSKKKNRK